MDCIKSQSDQVVGFVTVPSEKKNEFWYFCLLICCYNCKFSSIKRSTTLWIKCTKNAKNSFLDLFLVSLILMRLYMIVHMFETYSLSLLALWKNSNMLSVKKFEGSVKFTIALWSHHSLMIILIILEIYLLTSNWSKQITWLLIYIYINNSLYLTWKYSGIFVHRYYLTKAVSFEEQIMSKDKYTSMFLHKIEAIEFIILQIFCNVSEKNVCKQLSVCRIRFLLLSFLSHDFMNK